MENSSLMEVLMDFMKKAGTLALKSQENLQASLKEDASLITKVDLEISELFRHRMKKYLQSGNHCILDEENLPDAGSFFAKTTEYIWTLDPIDGTTTYYHGFPMWAVAVGLYKNLKPHLGAIYMPATQELVYTDGEKSYYIKNAFRPSAKKSLLSLHLSRNFTGKHIILQRRLCDCSRTDYTIFDLYANYVNGFYTLLQKSSASFFGHSSKFWDVSALIPISKNMGLDFRNVSSGKNFSSLSAKLLENDWRLRDTYLMCNPHLYQELKTANILLPHQ